MHIKTHLDNTLYLSSVWSDLSCAAELVIAGAPAGFTLQPCTNREERARESADCRMIFIYLIFSQTSRAGKRKLFYLKFTIYSVMIKL